MQDLIKLPENRFASCSDDQSIKLYRKEQNFWTCFKTLLGHNSYVRRINYNPMHDVICSCSSDLTVRIWSSTDSTVLKGHKACVYTLNSLDDMLISGDEGGEIIHWSIQSAQ